MVGSRCLLLPLVLAGTAGVAEALPFGAWSDDVSPYALGSYTVNVIFLQDSPGDWTAGQLSTHQARINEAVGFWNDASAERHHPGARLNLQTNFLNGGQPVTVPDAASHALLRGSDFEALQALGYTYTWGGSTDPNGRTATYSFNNQMRNERGTDWATTIYIRPYAARSFAGLNGPYINAHRDDSAWTYAHELAHIFGALDEYATDSYTSERSGYLYTYNTNAQYRSSGVSNPGSVPSLLKTTNNWTFSEGALDAIGWRDSDNDTIPDILDTVPVITPGTSSHDPDAGLFSLNLNARVNWVNSPTMREMTIKTLTDVLYRIDGGEWIDLLPDDGSLDEGSEYFNLQLAGLAYGQHLIDFRVIDSVDNFTDRTFTFSSLIPEPASLVLLMSGLMLLGRRRA